MLYRKSSKTPPPVLRAAFEALEPRTHWHAGHLGTFINAGGVAYVDSGGHAWQPDGLFTGGGSKPADYAVTGTTDDAIFGSRRFGPSFSYAIPVQVPGTYRVSLHFSEPWFTARGSRVFDVSAEGQTRLSNFDILSAASTKTAVTRTFDLPVTDGVLNLSFVSTRDNALVSGIAVERIAQVPPAPSGLSAQAISATQITLKWTDNSPEETSFAIERSLDGVAFTQIAVVNGNVTSYGDAALAAGTNYTYRVIATSSAGRSGASNLAAARTLAGSTQTPFGSTPIRLPGTLEAENFDNGGPGISFTDATPANAGGAYRNTPVDIYQRVTTATTSSSLKYSIGSIRAGEWLEYTIQAPQNASYAFSLNYASGSRGGAMSVTIDGQPWSGSINLPNTGGWSVFQTATHPARAISAGTHVVRISFDSATRAGEELGDVDWFRFTSTAGQPPTPLAPTRVSARAVGDTQVNLSWDDIAGNETSYIVQRKLQSAGDFATVATLPANSEHYIDTAVTALTGYVYRVIAVNNAGGGASADLPLSTWVSDVLRWKTGSSNPFGRYEAAGVTASGRMFVFGGYYNTSIQATARVDMYDPAANAWTQLPDMPTTITHAGQAVDGKYVYLAGGFQGDHPGAGTRQVWRFDSTSYEWTAMPPLPQPRGAGAMARVGTKLFFFGGLTRAQTASINQAQHWVFDLSNPSLGWNGAAPLPNPRNHLAAAELNGRVYAIGGQDLWNEISGAKANVDVYDPGTNTWSAAAPLPIPRSHTSASTFSFGGKIYVIGGATNNLETLRNAAVYNPATNAWTEMRALPGPRLTPVAGVIGKLIVVSTGSAYGLAPEDETWYGLLD